MLDPKRQFSQNLQKIKVIITTHYMLYGPSQALRDYFIDQKNEKLLFIGQPLDNYYLEDRSYVKLIEQGIVKYKKNSRFRTKHIPLNCLGDFFKTLYWIIQTKTRYDLFVGVDDFNAFIGLILKKIGLVKKTIYYVIDYFPTRFENRTLDFIYHKLDKFCVKYADETWNLSAGMIKARQKLQKIDPEKYNKQKIVPVGVWFNKIPKEKFTKIKKHQLVYVGLLIESMGVQLVIQAIPLIIKQIPDFHFRIIGGGEYEDDLKMLAKNLKVESYIEFTGWAKERQERDRLMADSACGVAPFNTEILDERVQNADPAKIKDYLVLGMPVILTNAPLSAYELEKKGCGIVIHYKPEDLAQAVITLFKDENRLKKYRENALKYIQQYDWKCIFECNLKRILNDRQV